MKRGDDAADERNEMRARTVLAWAFARLDIVAFACACAAVFAGVLFALTFGLTLKGAPPGVPVGPNLAALAAYFPGYSVSYGGAFVGAAYAALVGAVVRGLEHARKEGEGDERQHLGGGLSDPQQPDVADHRHDRRAATDARRRRSARSNCR